MFYMKHAILITAYKNIDQLIFLINCFDDNFTFYVHIDKKSIIEPSLIFDLKNNKKVSYLSRKYNVNWGGRDHLLAILDLCKVSVMDKGLSYFHLISGEDFPAKTNDYFCDLFRGSENLNFLESFKLPAPFWKKDNGGFDRFSYYNFYDLIDAKKNLKFIEYIVDVQKKYGIKRHFNWEFENLYAGSTWWSLSRKLIHYVLDFTFQKPLFLRNLRYSFCSEEMYFQTVLLNSPLASEITNDNLRYIEWEYRNGSCPPYLDESDLPHIFHSNKLFARKVNKEISNKLKDLVRL